MWTVSRYNCAQASACGLCQGITVLRLVYVDCVKLPHTHGVGCKGVQV